MSVRPLLTLIDRRADAVPIHVLFVGKRLAKTKNVFKRKDEAITCDHTNCAADAVDIMAAQAEKLPFDCVIIDVRDAEDGSPLNVVGLATLRGTNLLAVIARPEHREIFENMPGVDQVLQDPVGEEQIISTILTSLPEEEAEEERSLEFDETTPTSGAHIVLAPVETGEDTGAELAEVEDTSSIERENTVVKALEDALQEMKIERPLMEPLDEALLVEPLDEPGLPEKEEKNAVTKGFESSLSKVAKVDQGIWRFFVPIANFFYKKLAILVLSALFLTFLAYGAMIVFFMGSSSWSLPFELSRGHILVEKIERDLSSMNLRRNGIRQDITVANVEYSAALRNERDGELQLLLSKRTIAEEITRQEGNRRIIALQIERFKTVILDFKSLNKKGEFSKNLNNAYKKRLITRKSLNSGTLAVLETLHRVAALENEIAAKQGEAELVETRLSFLRSLFQEVDKPRIRVITSPTSDLAHLAREAIQAKNRISGAKDEVIAAEKRISGLDDSLQLISTNISSLESTPAARAIKAPVTVLFVPYTNELNVYEGQPLYSCKITIIWCSEIGKVGSKIAGETTAVHPLFGKPLRGVFVEAQFYDAKSVVEDIVHAGGPPLGY